MPYQAENQQLQYGHSANQQSYPQEYHNPSRHLGTEQIPPPSNYAGYQGHQAYIPPPHSRALDNQQQQMMYMPPNMKPER